MDKKECYKALERLLLIASRYMRPIIVDGQVCFRISRFEKVCLTPVSVVGLSGFGKEDFVNPLTVSIKDFIEDIRERVEKNGDEKIVAEIDRLREIIMTCQMQ